MRHIFAGLDSILNILIGLLEIVSLLNHSHLRYSKEVDFVTMVQRAGFEPANS